MKNLGAWCALAALGVMLNRDFLDWVWWHNWGEKDDENPAPLICVSWRVWCKLKDAYWWLWSKSLRPPLEQVKEIWWRFSPPERLPEPMDQDGRAPLEWLVIEAIGVWGIESWYKDEYDWEVKRKWDEFLQGRAASAKPETEESRSANSAD